MRESVNTKVKSNTDQKVLGQTRIVNGEKQVPEVTKNNKIIKQEMRIIRSKLISFAKNNTNVMKYDVFWSINTLFAIT